MLQIRYLNHKLKAGSITADEHRRLVDLANAKAQESMRCLETLGYIPETTTIKESIPAQVMRVLLGRARPRR